VKNNYSSRGEMFSALAMSKLAHSYSYGQYKVHLVNRDLWNDYEKEQLNKEQNEMEVNNIAHEKYFGTKDFDVILSDNDNNDMRENEMDINDVPLSSEINASYSSMDQKTCDNRNTSALPSSLQCDEEFEEDDSVVYELNESEKKPLKQKIDIIDNCGLTVYPNNPLFQMSIVKHLMSGNQIAVW